MQIEAINSLIMDKRGIPLVAQYLKCEGKVLSTFHILLNYNIVRDLVIILNGRLCRGGLGKGSSSFAKPTYKEMSSKNLGSTPLTQAYIVERMENVPQLDLTDPIISDIHDAFFNRGITYKFNGLWQKTTDLYKWIHTSWTKDCEISLCSRGFFTVLFSHQEYFQSVFDLGPWFWGRAGFFITSWFLEFDPNKMSVSKTLIWIRLLDLPMHFLSISTLRAIGDSIGRSIKIDVERVDSGLATFSCICVEVDLSKGLPEKFILRWNSHG